MEKKNVILLTVIAIATLLITVVGATFAYFAATITNEGDAIDTTTIQSASNLSITYSNGETISVQNILPGWGETYDKEQSNTVTVSNDTNLEVTFTMNWEDVTNDFNDKANLQYNAEVSTAWNSPSGHESDSLTSVNNISLTQAPSSNGEKFATQTLKPGEKISYIVQLRYLYKDSELQDSQGKTFSAKLKIDQDSIKVTQPAA